MKASVSLCLNHAPFAHDRLPKLNRMIEELELRDGAGPRGPFWVHDIDYRKGGTVGKEERVDFTLNQWRWALEQPTTHHAFATDDLELVPRFWDVLDAILEVAPNDVIGLLSNHPEGPALASQHYRFYATNSWIVGPMYILPHTMLAALLEWPGTYQWDAKFFGWSDDATLNAWVTFAGPGRSIHPLPTPIEHDPEGMNSTWSHTGGGDQYSRERVSWRKYAAQLHLEEANVAEAMLDPNFWRHRGGARQAPMQVFPGSRAPASLPRRGMVRTLALPRRETVRESGDSEGAPAISSFAAREDEGGIVLKPGTFGIETVVTSGNAVITAPAEGGTVLTLPAPPSKPKP